MARNGSNTDYRYINSRLIRVQIMPTDRGSDRVCPKSDTDSCPSGHVLVPCSARSDEFYCKQCSDNTFQPNENWISDKCRLRRSCVKPHMTYADHGSTVRDATCACMEGYHFPNEDQRACVPNKECPKGTAPGLYGSCELCLPRAMYSDTVGKIKECKPLTNCEKQNRCTVIKSNGEMDNICGERVKDLNTCEEISPGSSSTLTNLMSALIVGVVVVLIICLILVVFFIRRRRLHHLLSSKVLTEDEVLELQQKLIKESDRDPIICNKVLSVSCSLIEERIDRQMWTLAQELFRSSPKQGHFEQIVDTYREHESRQTVTSYLEEWKLWRGMSKESVTELFRCLRHIRRDDIIQDICFCLRNDISVSLSQGCHGDRQASSVVTLKDECLYAFVPCYKYNNIHSASSSSSSPPVAAVVISSESAEVGTKLLAIATDDLDLEDTAHDDDDADDDSGGVGGGYIPLPPRKLCSSHPSPSAPDLDEVNNGFPSMDNVRYSRHFSQPVQATS